MRTITIFCKKCQEALTPELEEVGQNTITFPDDTNAVPHKKFAFFERVDGIRLMVAKEEYLLKNHPDYGRFSGCCGSDGSNGMNKLCVNGHEVATEYSDCWTSYFIVFNLKEITIKEVSDPQNIKIIEV